MKFKTTFLSSLLAGIVFSFSSTVMLVGQNTDALSVALLYPAGLMIVLCFNLAFFSKKVGYVFADPRMIDNNLEELPVMLFGNLLGATLSGFMLCPIFPEQFKAAANAYVSMHPLAILASAFFCGILMFIAIHGFFRVNGNAKGIFIAFLCIAVIGFCRFDYFLTNIFYFAGSLKFTTNRFLYLFFSMFGNIAGAMFFALLYDVQKGKHREHHHHKHHSSRHHAKRDVETAEESAQVPVTEEK